MSRIKTIALVFTILFLFISCTSMEVQAKGTDYFIGKKKEKLFEYFKKNSLIENIKANDEEYYDEILFCTNAVSTLTFSKTKTVSYKVEKIKTFYNFWFREFSDGCLSKSNHYQVNRIINQGKINEKIIHQNDNAEINSELKYFNKIINENESYDASRQEWAFDNHKIGSSYYLYKITSKNKILPVITANLNFPSQDAIEWFYTIWIVTINEENRKETESHNLYYYYFNDTYYNENKIISKKEVEQLLTTYTKDGFYSNKKITGTSIIAYVKDGIVEAVKEVK